MNSGYLNRSRQGTRALSTRLHLNNRGMHEGPLLIVERRKIVRVDATCPVFLDVAGGLIAAYIVNISNSGSRLEVPSSISITTGASAAIVFSEMTRIKGRIQWRDRNTLGISFDRLSSDIHDFMESEHLGIKHFSHLLQWQHLRRKMAATLGARQSVLSLPYERDDGAHDE